ncbi:MAG: hypothetical protein ABR508_03500 [Candidatus Baltobacteraceae bacterium]
MRRLAHLRSGELPSDDLLRSLVRGWNNDDFVAQPEYLRALAQLCSASTLPILECGSGLTTIVCAAIAGRRGIEVWTLENHLGWLARVRNASRIFASPMLHLKHAPLRSYGDFDWYEIQPEDLPARFGLVICDGPRGTTRGGRFGLMPVLGDRLAPGSVILADDVHRDAERNVIEKWRTFAHMDFAVEPSGSRAFALITLR